MNMNRKASYNISRIVFLALLAICVIFHSIKFFSILALTLFVLYLLLTLNHYPIFYIKYFYIVFVLLATVLSCFLIEFSHFYLRELRINSSYVGALPLLLLSYFIMVETIILYDKKSHNIVEFNSIRQRSVYELNIFIYISYLTLIILTLCMLKVFPHPSFLLHLERADYAKYYGVTGFLGRLATNIPRLLVFPFFLIVASRGKKRLIGISCLVLASLYYLWIGNKFGAFFQIMYIFLIVLSGYLTTKVSSKRLLKTIKKISILFAILIATTLVVQSITYNGVIKDYFLSRIASEGQIWWSVFGKTGGSIHLNEIADELQSLELGKSNISDNIGSHYGIYKMMYYCAPTSVINSILSAGYRYTESGFACAFYYLGYWGPILYALIMGVVFAFLINKLSKAINEHKVFRIYIYIRFLLYATTAFSMFIFTPFWGVKNIALYIYLMVSHEKNYTLNINRIKVKI